MKKEIKLSKELSELYYSGRTVNGQIIEPWQISKGSIFMNDSDDMYYVIYEDKIAYAYDKTKLKYTIDYNSLPCTITHFDIINTINYEPRTF